MAHTGKLARAIVLDLALYDAAGDALHWERAVERARWVAGRLGPDPEHGAQIFHPGRLDPRNCSTSAIDSGECSDALARLLQHERAGSLDEAVRAQLRDAVERNAESYLTKAVLEKGITNQRLWAAMGLAAAWALLRRDAWLDPLRRSVAMALDEQRADGSWGYQPHAVKEGAHPGAADLSVYYHSRCIAFLQHIVDRVPALDAPSVQRGIGRALDFLSLVMTPDGLKPLTLEGKRWFWDGTYEAGSAAYDVFALLHGTAADGDASQTTLAHAAWRQAARHQRGDGALVACREPGNADFVCPDFHTADLAWTAQWMAQLPDPFRPMPAPQRPAGLREASEAGVVRLDGDERVALIRTTKRPANTQVGGAVGGGALAAVVSGDGERLLRPDEALCRVWPKRADLLWGSRRFLRNNRPRREGSQLAFVLRLLVSRGRFVTAARRLRRDWIVPALEARQGPISPDWALHSEIQRPGNAVSLSSACAYPDGDVPGWAEALCAERTYALDGDGLRVEHLLHGTSAKVGRIEYALPAAARDVQVVGEGLAIERRGGHVNARPTRAAVRLNVTYRL